MSNLTRNRRRASVKVRLANMEFAYSMLREDYNELKAAYYELLGLYDEAVQEANDVDSTQRDSGEAIASAEKESSGTSEEVDRGSAESSDGVNE